MKSEELHMLWTVHRVTYTWEGQDQQDGHFFSLIYCN